jgi:hypothetical protein
MGLVVDFHTRDEWSNDKLVHHNQSECAYRKKITSDGNKALGKLSGSKLCTRCAEIAAEK